MHHNFPSGDCKSVHDVVDQGASTPKRLETGTSQPRYRDSAVAIFGSLKWW